MVSSPAGFNYAEALQKALYFYECQRSGPLPADNRVRWRGDSGLDDGRDNGVDLTGGWHNAGDHVKFNFPIASSVTMLAWGGVEFRRGFERSGQWPHLLGNLRWICDYFIKCHTAPDELWAQVGLGHTDHAWWGPAEVMAGPRPSFKIDADRPGSDLAAETAAALAASAIVFADSDREYASTLLAHAAQLYDFADRCRGCYSDAVDDARSFYPSDDYTDELVWGAAWMFRATGDPAYLKQAAAGYDDFPLENGTPHRRYKDVPNWRDKQIACAVLLARTAGENKYDADCRRWIDWLTVGCNGDRADYTPGGLLWMGKWGSLRQAANAAFLAFVYSDTLPDSEPKQRCQAFAMRQIDYILGDNPHRRSFVVGFGDQSPRNPHHRTAHGSWANDIQKPQQNRHVLYGALTGGPDRDDRHVDDRGNYVLNEVSCDYNAGFTSALARMALEFGGTPLRTFPPEEHRTAEFTVETYIEDHNRGEIDARIIITNRTAWPARATTGLSIRYYLADDDVDAAQFKIQAHGPDVRVAGPISGAWSRRYILIDLAGVSVAPGDATRGQLEVRLLVTGPPTWDPAADWALGSSTEPEAAPPGASVLHDVLQLVQGALHSRDGATPSAGGSNRKNVALYSDGVLVCGTEPAYAPRVGALTRSL